MKINSHRPVAPVGGDSRSRASGSRSFHPPGTGARSQEDGAGSNQVRRVFVDSKLQSVIGLSKGGVIGEIKVGRLLGAVNGYAAAREVEEDKVDALVESISRGGLAQPILVRRFPGKPGAYDECFSLVCGAHRLAAVHRLGWDTIPCMIIECDEPQAKLLMIDENIVRHGYTGVHLDVAMARRKVLYEELHPDARHGGDRKSDQAVDSTTRSPSFTKATAAATGKSESFVEKSAARGKALADDADKIAGTSLDKGVELDALKTMTPEQRAPIIADAQAGKKVSARKVDGLTEEAEKAIRKAGFHSNKQFAAKIASYADADQVAAVADLVAERAKARADAVISGMKRIAEFESKAKGPKSATSEKVDHYFSAQSKRLKSTPDPEVPRQATDPVEPPAPVEFIDIDDENFDREKNEHLLKAAFHLRAFVGSLKPSVAKDRWLSLTDACHAGDIGDDVDRALDMLKSDAFWRSRATVIGEDGDEPGYHLRPEVRSGIIADLDKQRQAEFERDRARDERRLKREAKAAGKVAA
jgi:hypothetical protein